MRMILGQGLRLEQRMEQRMVLQLGQGLFRDDLYLDGSPESLLQLLHASPQVDDLDRVNYLIAGGWAAELLTGKKREHHDLDAIRLSKIPLSFRVDEQSSRSYFGSMSMSPEYLLEHHTTQVEWDVRTSYPDAVGEKDPDSDEDPGKRTVYVPTPEYLFMSKITGFMREPRDKDYDDLEALASVINVDKKSYSSFKDLLLHIPGVHPSFGLNDLLFKDLSAVKNGGTADDLAAHYLQEIIGNFREGRGDLARKQSRKFHHALRNIYRRGLDDMIASDETKIPLDRLEESWIAGEIQGFFTSDASYETTLYMPRTRKNQKEIKRLSDLVSIGIAVGRKVHSTEKQGKLTVAKVDDGFMLVDKTGQRVNDTVYTGMRVIEGEIIGAKRTDYNEDLFDMKGKYVALYPCAQEYEWLRAIFSILLENEDFKGARSFRPILEKKHPGTAKSVLESVYSGCLTGMIIGRDMQPKKAKRMDDEFGIDAEGNIRERAYKRILKEDFSLAQAISSVFGMQTEHIDAEAVGNMLDEVSRHISSRNGDVWNERDWRKRADALEKATDTASRISDIAKGLKSPIVDRALETYRAMLGSLSYFKSGTTDADQGYALLENIAGSCNLPDEVRSVARDQYVQDALEDARTDEFKARFLPSQMLTLARRYGMRFPRATIDEAVSLKMAAPGGISDQLIVNLIQRSVEPLPRADALRVYVDALDNHCLDDAVRLKQEYGLASEDRQLFLDDPERFSRLKILRTMDIPVDDETRRAAADVYVFTMFHPGAPQIRPYLKEKFGILQEELDVRVLARIDEAALTGHIAHLGNYVAKFGSRFPEGALTDRLRSHMNTFEENRQYALAAKVARVLGDPDEDRYRALARRER